MSDTVEIVIHGRGSGVSDRFRSHVDSKLAKLDRFALRMHRIDVEVSHEPNARQQERAFEVELTCHGKGPFIRAEAHAPDKYTAMDLAYAKLEGKLRRVHDKVRGTVRHEKAHPIPNADANELPEIDDSDPSIVFESGPLIVRTKDIEATEMSVEEAVDAMERVGHDFFLFRNRETGLSSVLYRRRGYDFGLIQLGTP